MSVLRAGYFVSVFVGKSIQLPTFYYTICRIANVFLFNFSGTAWDRLQDVFFVLFCFVFVSLQLFLMLYVYFIELYYELKATKYFFFECISKFVCCYLYSERKLKLYTKWHLILRQCSSLLLVNSCVALSLALMQNWLHRHWLTMLTLLVALLVKVLK